MAAVHGTAVEPFVALGLYAGLRKEEILGLRWANVHLSGPAPYISVRERVVYVCGKAVHEAELKVRPPAAVSRCPPHCWSVCARTGSAAPMSL